MNSTAHQMRLWAEQTILNHCSIQVLNSLQPLHRSQFLHFPNTTFESTPCTVVKGNNNTSHGYMRVGKVVTNIKVFTLKARKVTSIVCIAPKITPKNVNACFCAISTTKVCIKSSFTDYFLRSDISFNDHCVDIYPFTVAIHFAFEFKIILATKSIVTAVDTY